MCSAQGVQCSFNVSSVITCRRRAGVSSGLAPHGGGVRREWRQRGAAGAAGAARAHAAARARGRPLGGGARHCAAHEAYHWWVAVPV